MIKKIALGLLLFGAVAHAEYLTPAAPPVDPTKEYRQCGAPAREADGTIKRSSTVLNAYKKLHPCPVTGKSTGACPGWSVNHIIPLASGGCDSVINMAWMPNSIKSCAEDKCIDRWERKYYSNPHGVLPPM